VLLFDTGWALLFDEWPFFYQFFSRTIEELLLLYRSTVLLATAFFCSPRYRVGDTLLVLWLNWIISSKLLSIWRWYSYRRFDPSIPIASVVRYYTEIQSLTLTAVVPSYLVRQLGMPVVEFVCSGEFENRYSTLTYSVDPRNLFLLIDCTAQTLWSYLSVDEHSMLSYLVCRMELLPIDWTGSTLCCYCSCWAIRLLAFSYYWLWDDESMG